MFVRYKHVGSIDSKLLWPFLNWTKEELWSKEQGTDNYVNRFTPEKEQRMVKREILSVEKNISTPNLKIFNT